MPRQRARCRNPDCGTYVIHDQQVQVNDTTLTGFCKGVVLTLNFVVLFGALGLGSLALTTSFKWAVYIWVAGGVSLLALYALERRLDAFATIRYQYSCALCGKVWGDISELPATLSDLDHDILAA